MGNPGSILHGRMSKKHDIKRFKVFNFISLIFVGPTFMYIVKIGACIVIES